MKSYKAAFFDMDGVLVDSMPYHSDTWIKAFEGHGIVFDPMLAYRNEGRTGSSTINMAFQTQSGVDATDEQIQQIYAHKTEMFRALPPPPAIKGMRDFVEQLKNDGVDLWVVTGSAQKSLIDRLDHHYPACFNRDKMVTGMDVKIGKPHPEPYLKALEKSGYKADEVFVVENAPLGVQSAVGAQILTVAINTGILPDHELSDEKAAEVFKTSQELLSWWGN